MDTSSTSRSSKNAILAALSSALLLSGIAVAPPAFAQGAGNVGAPGAQAPGAQAVQPLTVTVTRFEGTGPVNVGDKVIFRVRTVSSNAQVGTVIVRSSNLTNANACRYANLPANEKYNCDKAFHVITEEDAKAGSFTPEIQMDFVDPANNNNVLAAGTLVKGDPVPVNPVTPPAPATPFDIAWTRTDNLGNEVYAGDVLSWTIRVTNKTGQAAAAFPRVSNLDGAVPPGAPNCRHGDPIAAGKSYNCATLSRRVTPADVKAGTFTPEITIDATRDREGTQIITRGIKSAGTPVTLKAGTRTDPLATPTDRVDGQHITLAKDYDAGFRCHRIPALTTTKEGWILAAWDGRPDGCGDAPQANSIVQRISKDGGKSWGPITVVAAGQKANPKHGYSDPSYVVDRESGKIFMFFVKSFDAGFRESGPGVDPNSRNVLHAAVMESEDSGQTWKNLRVITDSITANPATWRSRFAASGEGIQLQYGAHKGRLIQQYTIVNGAYNTRNFQAVSVYSDDHGKTWQVGTPVGTFMDENKVVELENGDVMLNSRTSKPGETARRVAISKDGGQTYGEVKVEHSLVDPRNNAAIIRAFPDAAPGTFESKILLFSNAKDPGGRRNGHISVSFDNGQTWSTSKQFDHDGMAYSTITALRDAQGKAIPGKYGILYEEPYSEIRYMPVSWEWFGFKKIEVAGTDRQAERGTLKFTFTIANHEATPLQGATFTPDPKSGWEWKTDSVVVPTLQPGERTTIEVIAKVGNFQNAGPEVVSGRVTTADGHTTAGSLTATFALKDGQQPAGCLAHDQLRLPDADHLPKQSDTEGPNKAIDGNNNTIWHTPYQTSISLPFNFDIEVPYQAGLRYLDLIPRVDGLNGRFGEVEVFVVKNGEETKLLDRTDISTNPALPLDQLAAHATVGETARLRVKVHSTLGDTRNKWASLAEICVLKTDAVDPTHDETQTNPGGNNQGGGNTDPGNQNPGGNGQGQNPGGQGPGGQNPGGNNQGGGNPGGQNPPVQPNPQPQPPVPGPQPSPSDETRPGSVALERLSGESRVETATKLAQADFAKGADTVIIARADNAADSVAAAPVAKLLEAPVLLTQSERLHPAVLAELKRLKPSKVVVMGGTLAISNGVEDAIVKEGFKVERIAGANRADTAAKAATKVATVGKLGHVVIADGADWQPTLVAGPAAVKLNGVTLLSNGNDLAPETAAFLKAHTAVPITAIGDKAKAAFPKANQTITAADAPALSLEVAKMLFADAESVGIATTADFADALTGGAHIARKHSPLLLVPATTPEAMTTWVVGSKTIKQVYIYGGEARISAEQAEGFVK